MDALQALIAKYDRPEACQSLVSADEVEVQAEKNFLRPELKREGRRGLVEELYKLLYGTPVYIVNMSGEFGLDRRSVTWQFENQKRAFLIAGLVFGPLFDYLHKHPAQKITAKNIKDGQD